MPTSQTVTARGRKKKSDRQKATPTITADASAKPAVDIPPPATVVAWRLWFTATLLVVGIWSYWPTLIELIATWNREPDYSHGFLVLPLAIYFLWLRRATFPGLSATSPVLAIGLMLAAVALRVIGARFFYTFLDGWSVLPWMAAVAAAAGGRRLLWWSLPSICFLFFMIPLPFSLEGQLSYPLQRIATKISCATLQLLGQPAFAEGNVILLNHERFEVAQACSGLRLFISILALTYAYIAIIHRPWWEKAGLALIAVPVAIIANAGRIVATALLYQITESERIRQFAHDSAGWATILFAAVMLWGVLRYFRWLLREEEQMDVAHLVQESKFARGTV